MRCRFIPAAVRFEDDARHAHIPPAMPFRASPVTGPQPESRDGRRSACIEIEMRFSPAKRLPPRNPSSVLRLADDGHH